MCWEACFVCWQCEDFMNGCPGQMGTFFKDLCPYYQTHKTIKLARVIKNTTPAVKRDHKIQIITT